MFETIKKVGAKLMDKAKDKAQNIKEDSEMQQQLNKWQTKFTTALASYQDKLSLMDERELIYLGTREVDGNINNPVNPTNGRKKSNNVRNIAYEFIETGADTSIPQPTVKAKKQANEWKAKMIEDSIKADLIEMNIERLNDMQERTCPIQGMSFFEVIWNQNKRTHSYIGEVDAVLRHPKQVIPQSGIYDIKDMSYMFVMSSVTEEYIKSRYGYDVSNEQESHPQVNTLGNEVNPVADSDKVTELVVWFKDEDGNIGRFVWVNNKPLEYLPNIYSRKLEKCTQCGEVKTSEVCQCGNKKFKLMQHEAEMLTEDYIKKDGSVIPAGTQIPYYVPKKYPLVMRENVPISFDFGGQSDIDIIRDQQDAIKKVVTKLQEKIMKGGSIVTLPERLRGNVKLTDDELKVIYTQPVDNGQFNVFSMQPDITKDLIFLNDQYKAAQSTLGITDSLQGKPDPTATSGVAKQLQIAQATGRARSKQANKYQAYKELFELIFEFKLAFCDEPRPYLTTDANGKPSYAEFSKYEFLEKDKNGEWYYDTEYLFGADANGGLPNDKLWIMNQTQQQLTAGAFGQLGTPGVLKRYWQVLESLHYPMAGDILSQLEEEENRIKEQQTMQDSAGNALNTLNPEEKAHLQQNPQLIDEAMAEVQGGGQQ